MTLSLGNVSVWQSPDKAHVRWVLKCFPAELPDVVMGKGKGTAAVIPTPWQVIAGLATGRKQVVLGTLAPDVLKLRHSLQWLLKFSWTMFLFQFSFFSFFFGGIPLLQKVWKICFAPSSLKSASFLPSLATLKQKHLAQHHYIPSFYFLILRNSCHLSNRFPSQGMEPATSFLCSPEEFL